MRNLLTLSFLMILLQSSCSVFNAAYFDKNVDVVGSGSAKSEVRDVANFSNVKLEGDSKLTLSQGDNEALSVEADDNILPMVETFVDDDTLVIRMRPNTSMKTITPIHLQLSVIDLEELHVIGNGTVIINDLSGDKQVFYAEGNGRIKAGRVASDDSFDIWQIGNGSISLDEVISSDTSVRIRGNGQVSIDSLTVTELESTIVGNGRFTVAGNVTKQTFELDGGGHYIADNLQGQTTTIEISGNGSASVRVSEQLNVVIFGNGGVTYIGNPLVDQSISGNGRVLQASR